MGGTIIKNDHFSEGVAKVIVEGRTAASMRDPEEMRKIIQNSCDELINYARMWVVEM